MKSASRPGMPHADTEVVRPTLNVATSLTASTTASLITASTIGLVATGGGADVANFTFGFNGIPLGMFRK